jgi:hypothetical protein
VSRAFSRQLEELATRLRATTKQYTHSALSPHTRALPQPAAHMTLKLFLWPPCVHRYVRCLKPNQLLKPGVFDEEFMRRQLEYSGLIEVALVRQAGFAHHWPMDNFWAHFHVCLPSFGDKAAMRTENSIDLVERCKVVFETAEVESNLYLIGRTLIFFTEAASNVLHELRRKQLAQSTKMMGRLLFVLVAGMRKQKHLLAKRRQRQQAEQEQNAKVAAEAERARAAVEAEAAAAVAAAAAAAEAAERRKREAEEEEKRRSAEAEAAAAARHAEAEALALAEAARKRADAEALAEKVASGALVLRSSALDEVLEVARHLGMSPVEDADLLWIADEALHADESQLEDGAAQGTYPLEAYFSGLYNSLKAGEAVGAESPGIPKKISRRVQKHLNDRAAAAISPGSDATIMARMQQLVDPTYTGDPTGMLAMLTEPTTAEIPIQMYITRPDARTFELSIPLSPTFDKHVLTARIVTPKSIGYPHEGRVYQIKCRDPTDGNSSEAVVCTVRSDRVGMVYTAYDNATPPQEVMRAAFSTACRDVDSPAAVEVTIPFVYAVEPEPARPSAADAPKAPPKKRPSGAFMQTLSERSMQALSTPLAAVGTLMPSKRPSGARAQNGIQETSTPSVSAPEPSLHVGVKVLQDRKPEWESGEPMLDFFGRASLASSKNMQLVLRDGVDDLDFRFLMGKADAKRTNIDYCAPLSCLQAFAFGLALFDNASRPLKEKKVEGGEERV